MSLLCWNRFSPESPLQFPEPLKPVSFSHRSNERTEQVDGRGSLCYTDSVNVALQQKKKRKRKPPHEASLVSPK